MFALYFLTSALGLPPYGAVPVTMAVGFVVGVMVYWIAVHRVIGRTHLMSLLSAFAKSAAPLRASGNVRGIDVVPVFLRLMT